jgi:cysteine desulfurase
LPNNLHVSWPGVDGERLLMLLDEQGVMASTGSACAANKQTASHVLIACGLSEAAVQGSLRLTLGRQTTPEQVALAASRIITAVRSMGHD